MTVQPSIRSFAQVGVVFGVIFRNLVYRAIDDLERRIEKLLGGTFRLQHVKTTFVVTAPNSAMAGTV